MLKSILTSHYNRMILLIIILTVIYISLIITKAFGETEQQCTEYSSKHLIIITVYYADGMGHKGDCNWLVDKLLYNNSGFKLSGFNFFEYPDFERTFVLTK